MTNQCFLQDKETSRPPAMEHVFCKRSSIVTQADWWTHIHTCADNGAQLVWRQPLRVSFYLKSHISLNTGLDCCEKIAAGLVPTHLCEPLRTLWIDYTSSLVHTLSRAPLPQQTADIFHSKCNWKSKLQLYSHPANFTFQIWNPTTWFNALEAFWNRFLSKVVQFSSSRSEHSRVWSSLQHWHVRAQWVGGRVAFRASCGTFYGHLSAPLPLIGLRGEPDLDRCLEKGHLFVHVLVQWSIYWELWAASVGHPKRAKSFNKELRPCFPRPSMFHASECHSDG